MGEPLPHPAYIPTKDDAYIDRDDEIPLGSPAGGNFTDRLLIKEWRNDKTNALSFFFWAYETADANGDWSPVWEIDTSHGSVHEHTYDRRKRRNGKGEPTEICSCSSIEELEEASLRVSEMMFNGWESKRAAYYRR